MVYNVHRDNNLKMLQYRLIRDGLFNGIGGVRQALSYKKNSARTSRVRSTVARRLFSAPETRNNTRTQRFHEHQTEQENKQRHSQAKPNCPTPIPPGVRQMYASTRRPARP